MHQTQLVDLLGKHAPVASLAPLAAASPPLAAAVAGRCLPPVAAHCQLQPALLTPAGNLGCGMTACVPQPEAPWLLLPLPILLLLPPPLLLQHAQQRAGTAARQLLLVAVVTPAVQVCAAAGAAAVLVVAAVVAAAAAAAAAAV